MIWIKPLAITLLPFVIVCILHIRFAKWRRLHLSGIISLLFAISILQIIYPVAVAYAAKSQRKVITSTAYDISDLPILTTWYDPELGGINCQEPCDTYANMEKVHESHYYGNSQQTAACIPQWLGRSITIQGLGNFKCRDTGGMIQVAYSKYFERMVIHVDVLAHPGQMICNACLWHDWQLN